MSSGAHHRRKGVRGEREVAVHFEQAGLEIRNLEGSGDQLVIGAQGFTFHVEAKRQERLALPMWTRQAEAEAPQGTVPVVAYRQSRQPWRVCLRLDDFVALIVTPLDAAPVSELYLVPDPDER